MLGGLSLGVGRIKAIVVGLFVESIDRVVGFVQRFGEARSTSKGTGPCTGANFHSVLSDGFEINDRIMDECGDGLFKQGIECVGVLGAEVVDEVIIDRNLAANPHIGNAVGGEFGESSSAGDPFDGGEEPECEEDPRIDGIASDLALNGLDGLVEVREIECFDELPDDADAMLWIEPLYRGRGIASGFVVVVAEVSGHRHVVAVELLS